MPETSFSRADELELIRLLRKFQRDGYWWSSEETMEVAHGVVSYWAPEIVIWRDRKPDRQILLTRYDGGIQEFADQWHLPGGYNNPLDRLECSARIVGWGLRTLQPVVTRIALRELGKDVRVVGIVDLFWWRRQQDPIRPLASEEHPYGWPLSIYVECEPIGVIKETAERKFFGRQDLPEEWEMISPHWYFCQKHL